ncbi:MAG TPA: single-stranded-DNA-specific exonuclease RecJ [Thermomicrobiales bacterium]|nr:single-stranded-DNA-specific exonuclease RecJ [Thermomicrobiales bacterium]
MRYRWLEPATEVREDGLVDGAVLLALLARRGYATDGEVAAFLAPDTGTLADPFLLADMDRAVDRLALARRRGEAVAVYGDYDVDGLTSTALLCRALDGLGLTVLPYVPHRAREGYGLHRAALDRLRDAGVSLVVAVDCGVGNAEEIAHARARGLDTIVLDHHRVPETLPGAVAVVNPRRADCAYPCEELAAVGVAYALARALDDAGYAGVRAADADLLALAALGTVADVVPLRGENRVLAAHGLAALRETARPGLRALCKVAGVEPARLLAWHIGYVLGPRLNAAGRIAEPDIALRLLLTDDPAEAAGLAARLDRLNRERQRELARILEEATARLEAAGPLGDDRRLIQLDGAGWSAGVAGLVAGRLTERYSRPVLILERGTNRSKGSARSVDGFNIVEALAECADLLDHYGGHAKAAGLTVANAHLDALHARLHDLALARLSADQLRPTLAPDLAAPPGALTAATVDSLARLEPCGHGNPEPLLLVRAADARWPRASQDGRHLFCAIHQGPRRQVRAVAFGHGERLAELTGAGPVDLVGTLRREWWQGEERLAFHVRDFRVTDE